MPTLRRTLLVAPIAFLLAACDSTMPHASHRISLSVTTGSTGASTATDAALADLIVTGTGGSVKVTSAQLVLSRIQLADASCVAGDDDENDVDDPNDDHGDEADEPNDADEDESDCPPVRAGPVLVNVPLDGTTKIFLDALVPAGTYTKVLAKLGPGEDGFSVKVVGVFTDEGGADHAFTFTSHMRAPVSVDFDSPVTIDASSQNVTIAVDVSSWFKDANGAIIDPTNTENQHAIEKAIRASLRAFEDDNHDGDDDHEEDDR